MKITWSRLAEKSYNSNLQYLNENWPLPVVQKFILEVERTLILLADNPEIFKWWGPGEKYKIGYISSHISFFYSFDDHQIMIHLFWDNRQNPKKLEKFLK